MQSTRCGQIESRKKFIESNELERGGESVQIPLHLLFCQSKTRQQSSKSKGAQQQTITIWQWRPSFELSLHDLAPDVISIERVYGRQQRLGPRTTRVCHWVGGDGAALCLLAKMAPGLGCDPGCEHGLEMLHRGLRRLPK
jgi:hypothetical protein